MESMVGARFFSRMDLKSGFWQVRMSEKSRQYTAFTVGSLGVYEFLWMLYGLCIIPEAHAELPGRVKSHLCPGVPGQCDSVFKDRRGPSSPVIGRVQALP